MVCVHVLHASSLRNILDLYPCLVKYPWNIWPNTNYEISLIYSCQTTGPLDQLLSCYSCTGMIFTGWAQAGPMNRLPGREGSGWNKQTNKQTRINWQVNWVLARQQAFPTRSSSPDSTHCLNQLLSFYNVEGICSQANVQVSTWLCSCTLNNCSLYIETI